MNPHPFCKGVGKEVVSNSYQPWSKKKNKRRLLINKRRVKWHAKQIWDGQKFNHVIARAFVCKNKNPLHGYFLLGALCYSRGKNTLYSECREIRINCVQAYKLCTSRLITIHVVIIDQLSITSSHCSFCFILFNLFKNFVH